MVRILIFALTCPLLAVSSGCGGSSASAVETIKSQKQNFDEITALFAGITDNTSADAALPKLEQAVTRANELKAKLDSYKLSDEALAKAIKESGVDPGAANAQAHYAAIPAIAKAQGRLKELGAVIKKLDDGHKAGK